MIQPAFHRERLNDLVSVVDDEVARFLQEKWVGSQRRDAFEDMHELAFRIIARAMFSSSLDDDFVHELSRRISAIQSFVVNRIRRPFLQWWFDASGSMRKYDRVAQEVKLELMQLIRTRKDRST